VKVAVLTPENEATDRLQGRFPHALPPRPCGRFVLFTLLTATPVPGAGRRSRLLWRGQSKNILEMKEPPGTSKVRSIQMKQTKPMKRKPLKPWLERKRLHAFMRHFILSVASTSEYATIMGLFKVKYAQSAAAQGRPKRMAERNAWERQNVTQSRALKRARDLRTKYEAERAELLGYVFNAPWVTKKGEQQWRRFASTMRPVG
jgi:hypothetical protein